MESCPCHSFVETTLQDKAKVIFCWRMGQSEDFDRFWVNKESSFSSVVTVTVTLTKAVNPSA